MKEIRMKKRKLTEAITEVEGESIDEIAEFLSTELEAEVLTSVKLGDGKKAILLVAESYYFRSENYASISIMLTDDGDVLKAVIVGAGGGGGLFNVGWGANSNYAYRGEELLAALGFEMV